MTDPQDPIEIPKRALFRGSEVCELLKVQPYVLRTWESEFPGLGVARSAGGPRIYRREDVEQVRRIKHLLLVEGLTLAGARRRMEDEATPVIVEAPLEELIGRNARDRLTEVKHGLRAILDMLAMQPVGDESLSITQSPSASRAAPARGRGGRQKAGTARRAVGRRKRSR
jgi:DNA-binding transcriptional MerR regulator